MFIISWGEMPEKEIDVDGILLLIIYYFSSSITYFLYVKNINSNFYKVEIFLLVDKKLTKTISLVITE